MKTHIIDKDMIAILTKGRYGGISELAQVVNKIKKSAILFLDHESSEFLKDIGTFENTALSSFKNMIASKKFEEIFVKKCGDILPMNIICCYDYLGPAFCNVLKNIYKKKYEAYAFMRCYNKVVMRETLKRQMEDDFKFYRICSQEDLDSCKNKLEIYETNSWILKPAFGTSSELVSPPIHSIYELDKCFKHTINSKREYFENAFDNEVGLEKVFLLEEYIDGDEYSVEGICSEHSILIVGICQKKGLQIEGSIRTEGINFSPIIDKTKEVHLKNLAMNVVKSIGIMNAAFHIEIRWDKKSNKPRIIEINPRLPGGLLCRIHKEKNRIDLAELLIRVCLGEKVPPNKPKPIPGVFGDLPLPIHKAGLYKGYKLPENPKIGKINNAKIEIVEFIPKDTIVSTGNKEVYYAHAFIYSDNHEALWDAVNWCSGISPIII